MSAALIPLPDTSLVHVAAERHIECAADEASAADALGLIKRMQKAAADRHKELKAPVLAKGREIDAALRAVTDPLDALERRIKDHLLDWRRRESARIAEEQRLAREENERREREAREAAERARAEAEARARDEAAAAGFTPAEVEEIAQLEAADVKAEAPTLVLAPAALAKTTTAAAGAVTVRTTWDFEIVDALRVPNKFWVIDEKRIRAAVQAGERDIPGVRVFETESLAARAR